MREASGPVELRTHRRTSYCHVLIAVPLHRTGAGKASAAADVQDTGQVGGRIDEHGVEADRVQSFEAGNPQDC